MLSRTPKRFFATARDILKRKQDRQRPDITMTTDFYRLDLGFLVRRSPIHYMLEPEEHKANLLQYEIMMKYNCLPPIDPCLVAIKNENEFYHSNSNDRCATHYRDLEGEKLKNNIEELEKQRKHGIDRTDYELPSNGLTEEKMMENREYYFGKSKEYFHTDPYTRNTKSIHYASCYAVYLLVFDKIQQMWTIPTFPFKPGYTFSSMRDETFVALPGPNASFHFIRNYPTHCYTSDFDGQEKGKGSFYRMLKGKRVYVYEMYHHSGNPSLDQSRFSDWAWVTVPEMHKYLSEKNYDQIKNMLTPF